MIYSGDVNKENIPELLKKFDFVMIARACLGNTSVFGKSYEFKDYLKLARKYHLGMKEIKIHALAFTKGKQGASEIREKITKAKTMREIINLYKSEQ